MQKLLRYINRRQWAMIAASIAFIVVQVWLDLKLPDYMSAITTLVQTEGSAMADILTQGVYMLLCALGSGVASVIVGYFAAQVAAGLPTNWLMVLCGIAAALLGFWIVTRIIAKSQTYFAQ